MSIKWDKEYSFYVKLISNSEYKVCSLILSYFKYMHKYQWISARRITWGQNSVTGLDANSVVCGIIGKNMMIWADIWGSQVGRALGSWDIDPNVLHIERMGKFFIINYDLTWPEAIKCINISKYIYHSSPDKSFKLIYISLLMV
jgi:hypothetical protein